MWPRVLKIRNLKKRKKKNVYNSTRLMKRSLRLDQRLESHWHSAQLSCAASWDFSKKKTKKIFAQRAQRRRSAAGFDGYLFSASRCCVGPSMLGLFFCLCSANSPYSLQSEAQGKHSWTLWKKNLKKNTLACSTKRFLSWSWGSTILCVVWVSSGFNSLSTLDVRAARWEWERARVSSPQIIDCQKFYSLNS